MSHKLYYRIPYVLTPACFGPCVALWSANLELEIFCAKKGIIFILESRMYAKRMQRVCTSTLSLDLIDDSLTCLLKQKRTKTLALSGSFFWPALSWQPRSSTPLRRSPLAALVERSQRHRRSQLDTEGTAPDGTGASSAVRNSTKAKLAPLPWPGKLHWELAWKLVSIGQDQGHPWYSHTPGK